jgi:GTPase involved in cell partitioning and DNA repair
MVKFCFNIPLVLTSSAICIINSISEDPKSMKIPNITVNAISVLIMCLNSSVKASEKFECFKRLSQQFMILSQEIEGMDHNIDQEKCVILLSKYDNLIQDCAFEEIPSKYKHQVSKVYIEANRNIPIQLNGTIGNVSKRNSKDINNNIV